MVDYTEDRVASPSVPFFFARLGVFLESSNERRPKVGFFVPCDCAFRLVLVQLFPLIHHSLYLFYLAKEIVQEEVKSSDLETVSSSRDDLLDMGVDIVASRASTSSPPRML